MKLYLPGLSDGSYDLCRRQFAEAEQLLNNSEKNRKKLDDILKILEKNPEGARLLEAEDSERYRQIYDQLAEICSKVEIKDSMIALKNITCADADGYVFEHYDQLLVCTDVFRGTENYPGKQIKQHLTLTPYQAIAHCQQQGQFLPSSALMINIHYALFEEAVELQPDGKYKIKNVAAEQVLRKFQDRGDGVGGHWVNTLVDWGTQQLIHYPKDSDFPTNGGTSNVNASLPRRNYPFDRSNFSNVSLEQALRLPNYKQFVQNYTGLHDPAVLLKLAKYHEKIARVWVSGNNDTRAAWFGCGGSSLDLDASGGLGICSAVRGVQIKAP